MFISWGGRICRRLWLDAVPASGEAFAVVLGENEPRASDLLVATPSSSLYQDAAVQDCSGFEGSVMEGAGRFCLAHYFLDLSKQRLGLGEAHGDRRRREAARF